MGVSSQTRSLVRWCQERKITVIAYGSLGGSANRDANGMAAVHAAAHKYSVSTAQVLLRWALQQGVVVIPGATSEGHIAENLRLLRPRWSLTEREMRDIEASQPPSSFKRWRGLCADGDTGNATTTSTSALSPDACKPSV